MKDLIILHFDDCALTGSNADTLLSSFRNGGNLIKLSLGMNDFCGSAKDWAVHLQGMKHLMKLSLNGCCLDPRDVVDIALSTGELPNLAKLNLSENKGLGENALTWAASLQSMIHLKSLDLSECGINKQDIPHITSSVGEMPNLADLDLSDNKELGGNAVTWAASLQSMIHLKKLDMSNCSINSRDMKYITESVSRMRNIVDCDFSSYPGVWRVQSLGNGIELSIKMFSLTGRDMADVLQSFNNRSDLVRLTIDGICGLGGSASIWTPPFQNLTELKKVELSDCSLQNADIEHIAAALGQVPNLADLNLSKNSNLGGNAGIWAASLQRMMHLKSLGLSECGVNGQDLLHIASSVGEMPNLADLNLSKNLNLGGNAGVWAASLQRMMHLKSLGLSECDINEHDIPHIASSVGEMPNLTDLVLSSNMGLGGNAEKWAASLQSMIHLMGLHMSLCSFNSCDLKYIAESVSRMRNIVDCDFSSYPGVWRVQSLGNGIALSIKKFSLTGKDMADVLQSFNNRSDLVRMTIDGICGLGGSASIWTPLLQNLTELKKVELSDCSLQNADIEHIAAALGQVPNLAVLNLSKNSNLGGNAGIWAASLQRMMHLKSLGLSECGVNGQDLLHIASSVREMPNLADLNLSKNSNLGGNAGIWAASLQRMMHLKSLGLSECGVNGQDLLHIASSVGEMPNLAVLNLSKISNLGGNAGIWVASLQRMMHLKSLGLSECGVNGQDLLQIASSVGEMPNLTDLVLSSNMGLGGNAEKWAASLQSMIHLKRLDMSLCSINSRDLKYIAELVSRMRNIVDCDFSSYPGVWRVQSLGNGIELSIKKFSLTGKDMADVLQSFNNRSDLVRMTIDGICGLGGSASIWTPLLQNLTELKKVELSDCSLQNADIEHIAAALGQIPNLADLNLSKNSNLGGNAGIWAASLQRMMHLKSLDLSKCDINEQDIPHIASSVGEMPNLADLNLPKNSNLGGNAGIWAASLQRMMHLKSLDLSKCDINEQDIPHIASSVGEMPILADLNLSGNKGLGGNAETWAACLQKMIHLKSLALRGL
ncbi:uncharacterized protein LOC119726057 [Patiria miniata]|uniref:Uncharacterized protein n=1 Tax=Patiria miniata TaxID=46514 RepID=A0A913ZPE3_PATMI|nr:uncharacterized protein LOC119726057 [Patiria miniata]